MEQAVSATEELRRLLDERGVECEQFAVQGGLGIRWRDVRGVTWRAYNADGMLNAAPDELMTTFEAIEATLGRW